MNTILSSTDIKIYSYYKNDRLILVPTYNMYVYISLETFKKVISAQVLRQKRISDLIYVLSIHTYSKYKLVF